MDKNLIKIDDLFRERLSGGEEEDRAGAWFRMRDLLDNEMPTNAARGINWRRMFSATAALALLAVVSIGGYEMTTAMKRNNTGIAANTPANNSSTSDIVKNTSVKVEKNNVIASSSSNTLPINNKVTGNNKSDNNISKNISPVVTGTIETNNLQNNFKNKTDHKVVKSDAGIVASNTKMNTVTTVKSIVSPNNDVKHPTTAVSSKVEKDNTVVAVTNSHFTRSDIKPNGTINAESTNSKLADRTLASIPRDISVNSTSTKSTNSNSYTKQTVKEVAVTAVDNKLVTDPETGKAVRDRSGAHVFKTDTIDKTTFTKTTNTIINPKDNQGITQSGATQPENNNNSGTLLNANKAIGNATPPAAKGDNNNDLNTKKSRGGRSWNISSFNEMYRNFKYNLAQLQFEPGIIGGINSTLFGNSSNNGFQLGVVGNITLNDNFSLQAELKYFQRFSSGVYSNDYTTYTGSLVVAPNTYTITKNSVQHYFNYSNFNSIEMPIGLHYQIGKFDIIGGANFVYNFAVGVEDISHPTTTTFQQTIPEGTTWQSMYKNTPIVSSNDFSSRLGIGYLAGLSYYINHSLFVDGRMTQTVWDNTTTAGAKQVSNTLYKTPSFQLSLGYYFNRNKNMPADNIR